MSNRQRQILSAIAQRISELDAMSLDWSRNSRAKIAEHGAARFNEVLHAGERGCRATFLSIFGHTGSRAEQERLRRDLNVMAAAGIVTITTAGRKRFVRLSASHRSKTNASNEVCVSQSDVMAAKQDLERALGGVTS